MPAEVLERAFTLGPGVYKLVIDYDRDEVEYKFDLKVYGTRGTPEVSNKSPPKQINKKTNKGDSIVIKLNDTRKFQVKETLGDDFTETGDYGINTVKQEVFFQDPVLGWVKVGEMFSSYPKTGTNSSPDSHDRAHKHTYYGKFLHVKKSEFRAVSTNLGNADFTEVVPSMNDKVAAEPIDMIVSLALLNGILHQHHIELKSLCKCFNNEFATQYLKANTSYRNNANVKESLKTLNGLSHDDIVAYYREYSEDIEKISGGV
jgi:hypothetical protein